MSVGTPRRLDPTLVAHADAVMFAERHVAARALALLGLFATPLGVGVKIQVVMLFRVAAILAVLPKLSHLLFLPDGSQLPDRFSPACASGTPPAIATFAPIGQRREFAELEELRVGR
jgi:hypothetical protein